MCCHRFRNALCFSGSQLPGWILLLGVFSIILFNFANVPTPYPYFSPAIIATQCVLLPIFAIINVLHDVITPEAADTLHGLASLTSKILPSVIFIFSIRT